MDIVNETHSIRTPSDLHPRINPGEVSSSKRSTALVRLEGTRYRNRDEDGGVEADGDGGKSTASRPPLLGRGVPGPHMLG